jgi:hypothetical protein
MNTDAMVHRVRTTVTLDPDTRLLVERAVRECGLTFKEAVNEGLRASLGGTSGHSLHRGNSARPVSTSPKRWD